MEILGEEEADVLFVSDDRDWSDFEFEAVFIL